MFDQAFIDNPYPTYQALRESGSAHWFSDFLGGAWLFPRHADIGPALRDPRLSARRSHCYAALLPAEVRDDFREFDKIFSLWLLFQDPPEHTALRKLMNKGFTPQVIEAWSDAIASTASLLIDALPANTPTDFMSTFAHPFPAMVISEMMGVGAHDQAQFIEWSDDIARFFGNPASSVENAYRAQASLLELTRYFADVVDARRAKPGNDLISLLIRIEEDGDVLSGDDVAAQCSMLMFGGHETTRNLIGNGMLALLRNPDQLAALRADRSLLPNAIKELLRYDSPVQYLTRIATEDFDYAGAAIKLGQMIIPAIASGNRDPARFADPDVLDIRRTDISHYSFGQGPHVCIGTRLALQEAEVAFGALLDRFSSIAMTDAQPVYTPNFGFRGLATLHLSFAPSLRTASVAPLASPA